MDTGCAVFAGWTAITCRAMDVETSASVCGAVVCSVVCCGASCCGVESCFSSGVCGCLSGSISSSTSWFDVLVVLAIVGLLGAVVSVLAACWATNFATPGGFLLP